MQAGMGAGSGVSLYPLCALPCDQAGRHTILSRMEFLNFLIIIWAAWLLWRRPEKERFAFRLLILSCIVMAVLFLIGTHTSLVPRVNL
jgi:heme A synthase